MGQVLFKEKCGFRISYGSISQGGHIFSRKNNGATGFLRSKNYGAKTVFFILKSPKTRPGIPINFDPSLTNYFDLTISIIYCYLGYFPGQIANSAILLA